MQPHAHVTLAQDFPLDFTLQYPPRREYFQEHFRGQVNMGEVGTLQETLLYVHVPFCQTKCYFCNFAVDVRQSHDIRQGYTDRLCTQIQRLNDFISPTTTVPGIDIGGGTPTLLDAAQLEKILNALQPWLKRTSVSYPVSIETTPAIASSHPERLHVLASGGVDRISMGLQSANAETLAAVNRGAQQNMNETAIMNMRAAGFRRINADIIFGLPGQTNADWRASVQMIIDLGFDSVTTYDCLYRGKGRALTKRTPEKPTPERYGELYDMAFDMLTAAGYHASYGSVNYSRHVGDTGTSPYFENRLLGHIPYLGTGNYASSQIGNTWWFAPYGVNQWGKAIDDGNILPMGDVYTLPKSEVIAKQVLLSFNYGVIDNNKFKKRFGLEVEAIYADALSYALHRGFLVKTPTGYAVAKGQFRNMPLIRALFYTPQAIEWVSDFTGHTTNFQQAAE